MSGNLTLSAILSASVNGAIVSALLAAVVWLGMRIAPRRWFNASTRYAIWWIVLIAVVAMPVLYLPLRVASTAPFPTIEENSASEVAATIESTSEPLAASTAAPVVIDEPASSHWPRFPLEIRTSQRLTWVAIIWAVISWLLVARLCLAIFALRRRKRAAFSAPREIAERLDQWIATCGTNRIIAVACSSEISTPVAAGLRSPAILIPAALIAKLDESEIDQIGLHETAHLARHDDFALIVQRVIEALFALHPVVRWIGRKIDLEREIACDDFVVAATGRARPYAQCLTRVVELAGGSRESLIAAAATEEPSHLARRVEMLLDKKRNTGTRLLKVRLLAAMGGVALLLGAAAHMPGMVAFAMQEPPLPPIPPVAPTLPAPPSAAVFAPPQPPAPPAAHPSYVPGYVPVQARVPLAPPAAATIPPAAFAPEAPVPPTPPAAAYTPTAPPFPRPVAIAGYAPATPYAPPAPPAAYAPQAIPAPASPQSPTSPTAPPAPAAPGSGSISSSIHSHNGEYSADWHWRDGLNSRDIRMNGHIEFTDDESDIKSMPPGSFFSYEEDHGFSTRRFQAIPDGAGGIKRQYLVDGHDHAIDSEAQAWWRAAIPDVLRETGIDVNGHVQRILKRGGVPAVIAEIGKIHGAGGQRRYIEELLADASPSTEQFQSLLRIVRAIPSDGEKRMLLVMLARHTMKDNLRDYLFDAANTINSAGDRRMVLLTFVRQDPSTATLGAAARSAEQINSDGDKAAVLLEIMQHYRGNESIRGPFFRSLESMHSAGDRSRVLTRLIDAGGDNRDTLVDALRAAAATNSDGDRRVILQRAADHWKEDDAIRRAYFEAADTIHSAGDRGMVLNAVLNRQGISAQTMLAAIRSTEHIASAGDQRVVLVNVIDRHDPSAEVLIEAVKAAALIPSDGDKASVLMAAIRKSSDKPAVRSAIRDALKTVHSDGSFRQLMNALDRSSAI